MTTGGPDHLAGLAALLRFLQTVSRMTDPLTGVTTTRKGSPALAATGDSLHQTEHVLPLLMTPVAELGGEGGAGGAALLTVTGVGHRVVTLVSPPARLPALRGLGPAMHRGIEDTGTALATQLVKTHIGTPLTVARVTKVLTVMQPRRAEDKRLTKTAVLTNHLQDRSLLQMRGQGCSSLMQHSSPHLWRPQLLLF